MQALFDDFLSFYHKLLKVSLDKIIYPWNEYIIHKWRCNVFNNFLNVIQQHFNVLMMVIAFKVNNRNARKKCEICSTLTIKTPERRYKKVWNMFKVNHKNTSTTLLMSLKFVVVPCEQASISAKQSNLFENVHAFFKSYSNPLMPDGNKKVTHT